MMISCSMPAATASSTAYWMTGLSTSGSISLGCALVAGRKRVPQPAAVMTAFLTRKRCLPEWSGELSGKSAGELSGDCSGECRAILDQRAELRLWRHPAGHELQD